MTTPTTSRSWRLSAWLLAGLCGVALQLQQAQLWPMRVYAGMLVAALQLAVALFISYRWGWRPRSWARPLARSAELLCAASASAALLGLRALWFSATALSPQLEGQDVQVTAVIAAMPQPHESGVRLRLQIEAAQWPAGTRPAATPAPRLPQLVDVTWYASGWGEDASPVPPLWAGERWRLTLRLKAPHGARNPHGFDYELWLWEQGVQASGYVRSNARLDARQGAPQRLEQTGQYRVERWRQQVRDAIVARFAARTPTGADGSWQRAGGVVAALVTGDQRAIERSDWDVFRATGVAHLMSISGLHITMFAWLAAALIGWLWRRSARLCLWWPAPLAGMLGGLCLAAGYAWFSGWGVPAQRTIYMLSSVVLLHLTGQRWPWPQVWLLAATVVLLIDPWAMLQAGFWLSFVAVGVLFASNRLLWQPAQRSLLTAVRALLREQSVVTLALTPLTLLLFGQISLVSWVANILAIPWTTLVVTPLALLGVLWPPLWQAAAWAVRALGMGLQWLAAWPWAQLSLPQAPLWAGLLAAAGGCWLVLRLPWRVRLLALPLLLPALDWQVARPAAGQFDLLALDVGQGQAVLLRTAKHSLLYDAGPRYSHNSDAGQRVVVPLLRALGERLDMLLLSHADSDHTGGAAAVLAQQPQARWLAPPGVHLPELPAPRRSDCRAGLTWSWDGVRLEVLHPPADINSSASSNARSCVLRVTAQANAAQPGRSALLAGDIEQAQERALLAAAALTPVDWLLVPHHGSKTSSSAEFLDALQPRLAMVQSGYRNRFGHPAPAVTQRYQERSIHLLYSPGCGALWWSSAQAQPRCQREQQQRYWQHQVDRQP